MAEDFNQVRTTPSLASVPVSTRLGPYPASIRAMWILGAVHDCLKEGKVEEAIARVALLCAYDQSAADSGNWLLSQELLLEQAPPYTHPSTAFAGATMPATSFILVWRTPDG